MKCAWFLTFVAFGVLACVGSAQEKKGEVVELNRWKSQTPADWVKEKPKNLLRLMQFRLPRAKDESADAELALFENISGTLEVNTGRWKAKFNPPEGKKIDDVIKTSNIKIGTDEVRLFDIEGIYKDKEKPIDPDSKAILRPGYRMLAIQWEAKENTYHMTIIGPAKTVEHHRKAFEEWLKAFK